MSDTLYRGEQQILYLVIDEVDCPIACLTDNSFSETVESIDTTTVDNGGWKTSQPTNQSYSISFSGLVIDDADEVSKHSLTRLRILKRARTRVEWKIGVDGVFEQIGEGYIIDLEENAPAGDILAFSGTLEGYGEPTIVEQTDTVYTYEDNTVYIFND